MLMSRYFEFSLAASCPVRCQACPQDVLARAYGRSTRYLSPEAFETALAKIPPEYDICIAGFSEPYLNRHCSDFIRRIVEAGRTLRLFTTAMFSTDDDIDLLCSLPTYRVRFAVIHVPDALGRMRLMGCSWDDYRRRLRRLGACSFPIGFACHAGRNYALEIADICGRRPCDQDLNTRGGNIRADWIRETNHDEPLVCMGRSGLMLPDGRVLPCCMDWGLEHVMGNLLVDGWDFIQNSPGRQRIRENLAKPAGLCQRCVEAVPRDAWEAMTKRTPPIPAP